MISGYGPPAVNFYSMLSGLGDTIAENRTKAARAQALDAATQNGVSYGDAMRGLLRAGDVQGAQMFATLQNHKDALDAAARSEAHQAERDKVNDQHWAASNELAKRAADRADEDKYVIKDVVDPNTGNVVGYQRVNTRGQEGLVPMQGAPSQAAPTNPFANGTFKSADAAKAAGFTDRMLQSEGVLSGVDGQPGVVGQGSDLTQDKLSRLPLGVGNYAISADRQKYEQARRDFTNAQLRRESGAAIAQSEFDSADKQYFPQPGDSADVIKQKGANRRAAIEAMGREGGTGYRPNYMFNQAGGLIRMPKLGEKRNGFVYKGGDPGAEASWIKAGE